MIVRFGFVAMSMQLEDASPSKTMTLATFNKLVDREAGIRRLEAIAQSNLHNTLRLLKHCRYMDVKLYRMTSKIIPLATHPDLRNWDPYPALAQGFKDAGAFAQKHGIRVSFHPDHFTVLSTPRAEVYRNSVTELDYHVRMLEAMGLDERATCNIHVGGSYGNKEASGRRFVDQFNRMEDRLKHRITLENDDKTFTALETLRICEEVGVPMVLDIHHHAVNPGEERTEVLWPDIMRTWEQFGWNGRNGVTMGDPNWLPPKLHVSSPKSESDLRGHADYVDPVPLLQFLYAIAGSTIAVDVMIEAKRKDESLVKLMDDMRAVEASGAPIRVIDGASVEVLG